MSFLEEGNDGGGGEKGGRAESGPADGAAETASAGDSNRFTKVAAGRACARRA